MANEPNNDKHCREHVQRWFELHRNLSLQYVGQLHPGREFDFLAWRLGAIQDLIFPAVATSVVAAFSKYF